MFDSAVFFAYIDPGTGSLIWQIVAAGLVTAGFALRYGWRRIRGLSRKSPRQDEPAGAKQEMQGEGDDEREGQ